MLGTRQIGTFELGTSSEAGNTGQAQANIKGISNSFAQVQVQIFTTKLPAAQTQALIQHFTAELGTVNSFGSNVIPAFGYAPPKYLFAQAQTYISPAFNQPNFGQAQTKLISFNNSRFAQAVALISPLDGILKLLGGTWLSERGPAQPNYPSPPSNAPALNFAAVFIADETGTWQFKSFADDVLQFYVNSTLVINDNYSITPQTGNISLTLGQLYTFHADYQIAGPPNYLSIEYKRPSDTQWWFLTDNGPPWIRQPLLQRFAQAQAKINAFNYPRHSQAQAFILKLKGLGQAQTTIDTHTRYSDIVIRDGAIAYWRLNEANGTTARDFIGTLDGIYTGSPALNQSGPLLISGALSVLLTDSDSVFVDTPTPTGLPSGNSDRTIEAWYKSSSANADVIFGYGNNNTREQFVVFLNYNGNIAVSAYNEDPGFTVTGFNDGNWHYLAATYTGSSRVLEIWFDGVSKGTYTFSTNLNTVLTGSDIGRLYYANGFAFNGNLSNIAVYPTALNAAAIFSHSIGGILLGNGQAQTFINAIQYRPAQAQAYVSPAFNQPNFGQAQAKINAFGVQNFGQSQTYIGHYQFAQAQAKINAFNYPQFGQALSAVKAFNVNQTGQAQAFTLSGLRAFGQAQAYIGHYQFGQAQAYIGHYQFGQAQARMLRTYNVFGQANAQIGHQAVAQAQARLISFNVPVVGQSLAFIRKSAGYANAQARIIAFNIPNYGQSQGYIKKLLGTANAQATIRHIYYGFAQANAYNLGPFWTGQAQTWTKQTYPVIGMDTNYALVVNGASASDSTGQLFAPTNVIDGNDYGPDWSIGTGLNQTLNIDLGQARLINFYRILPIRYDCTVNLQYSTDNLSWSNAVLGIQFAVGFFDGIDTSKVVTGQIGPITAQYWRLYVTDGGSNGGIAILTFELGIASVKSPTFAQAQAFIGHMALGQSMAYVSPGRGTASGQAQAQIVITVQRFALSRAWIIPPTAVGQGVASILQTYRKSAQVSAWVIPPTVIAQALATIKAYDVEGLAQATGDIKAILFRRANTQAFITKPLGIAQVQAQIKSSRSWSFGQSRVSIGHFAYSQAQAFIAKTQGAGQVMAQIKRTQPPKVAQAQASIVHLKGYAQVTADIKAVQQVYGNASALLNQAFGLSSVQTTILHTYYGFGQTNTSIKNIATNYSNPYGQAQAMVFITYYVSAQVIAWVSVRHTPIGQAMAFIRSFKYGQAQAKLNAYNYPRHAQAQAYIAVNLSITVATPNSESHSYLVRYNNYDLPGYAQDESYDSIVTITPHPAMGVDGSLSEYLGLTNKSASIRMRAWEPTYLLVKEKVQKAAVMLSSFRGGFAKLYVQQPNAYFLAMVKKIAVQKDAKSSGKILDYIVDFETMPWLISNDTYEISGTGLIDTGSRTISDGGWTPTKILVSGTDVTITAYTETNNYSAGSIAIIGLCTNLVIDSENFTAIENGVNKNGSITTKDYAIHVGPGKTFFQINGATSCVIQYNNRWYLSSTKKISTQTIATTVLPASIIQSQYGQTGALISSGTKQSYAQVRTVINDPIKRSVAAAQALLTSPITSVSGNAGGVLRNGRSWSFAQAQAGVLLPNVEGLGQAKALVEGATKYKSGQASAITTQPKRLVLGSARAVIY